MPGGSGYVPAAISPVYGQDESHIVVIGTTLVSGRNFLVKRDNALRARYYMGITNIGWRYGEVSVYRRMRLSLMCVKEEWQWPY